MKNLITLFALTAFSFSLSAQQVGINLRAEVAKNFKLNKKTKIELAQQLQLNPEIKNVNKKYNRIFDEFELFPFLKDDDDDDDDDDDSIDGPANVDNGFKDLNDAPYAIDLAWRSSTSVDFDYKIRKWLRFGQSYSLLLDAEDIRQLARTDLTIQPKLPGKKLDVQCRIAHQLGASQDKGRLELDSDFSSRTALEWEFKKRHVWFNNFSINGAFDEKIWEWDRFRYDTGLEYKLSKTHSFSFGYRFQQRLNRKKNAVSHAVSFAYSFDF